MKRLSGKTSDRIQANLEKIAELFPHVVTEAADGRGGVRRAVDFDLLRQELSDVLVEGPEERYQLMWPGKREAILHANTPTDRTLRPVREDSEDWDHTQNVFIEGDNLEVLKLLQGSYLDKVKCIYIDPPYNTGKDFVYRDRHAVADREYRKRTGQADEEGNRLVANPETGGKFHSEWLTSLYARIKAARPLLSDDGVMFISIDDHEVENLIKLCKELFGPDNYVATLVWEKKKKGAFLDANITNIKEYILVCCKNRDKFAGLIGEINEEEETYPCIKTTNARGVRVVPAGVPSKYREKDFTVEAGTRISSGNMELVLLDPMVVRDGVLALDMRIDSNWIYSQSALNEFARNNELYITQDLYVRRRVTESRRKKLKDILFRVGDGNEAGSRYRRSDNLFADGWGTNEDGNEELHKLLGIQNLFDYPKPTKLIAKLLYSLYDSDCIIMDFFAGSGTTADAVMQLNALDDPPGRRKYILVQFPESLDERLEGIDARGRRTIQSCIRFLDSIGRPHLLTEIGKERIRRAARRIREETGACIDYGFRVFRLDSSNMKDVWYAPDRLGQGDLADLVSHIKEDRTGEDLLIQVMLELGLELSLPMETRLMEGKTVHYVAGNSLVACFDHDVPESVIERIAADKPLRAVFRDLSFPDDAARINLEERFKLLSPGTDIRVL